MTSVDLTAIRAGFTSTFESDVREGLVFDTFECVRAVLVREREREREREEARVREREREARVREREREREARVRE